MGSSIFCEFTLEYIPIRIGMSCIPVTRMRVCTDAYELMKTVSYKLLRVDAYTLDSELSHKHVAFLPRDGAGWTDGGDGIYELLHLQSSGSKRHSHHFYLRHHRQSLHLVQSERSGQGARTPHEFSYNQVSWCLF